MFVQIDLNMTHKFAESNTKYECLAKMRKGDVVSSVVDISMSNGWTYNSLYTKSNCLALFEPFAQFSKTSPQNIKALCL